MCCHEKGIEHDACIAGNPCQIWTMESSLEMLSTSTYFRREKKTGVLVNPKYVTVLGSLDDSQQEIRPERPYWPGKSVFCWDVHEAHLNFQFSG